MTPATAVPREVTSKRVTAVTARLFFIDVLLVDPKKLKDNKMSDVQYIRRHIKVNG